MTRDECRELEERLVFPGASADLQCDAYRLTLEVQRSKMRMVVMIYIDGIYKGKWRLEDCEERRRFLRPVAYRPKQYSAKLVKTLGKKWCDAQRAKYSGTYYMPFWMSVRPLLRHLHKHNQSVVWIQPERAA